jgi:hypothetical protein
VIDPATAHLDLDGPHGLTAFGQALDGATRIAPDERAYHIVESIILEIAIDEQARGLPNGAPDARWTETFSQTDLIHPELRRYLGNIVDYYIQDIYWALSEPNPDGLSEDAPYQQRLTINPLPSTMAA